MLEINALIRQLILALTEGVNLCQLGLVSALERKKPDINGATVCCLLLYAPR